MLPSHVRRLIPACLVLSLSFLPTLAHAVTVVITGGSATIAANTSWGPTGSGAATTADVFWVKSNVTVNGGITFTLLPGTLIKFDTGLGIQVNGTMQAIGTAVNQIYLTSSRDDTRGGDTNGDGGSTVAASSDWTGVTFTTVSPDTGRMTFCDVGYAGYGARGAVVFNGAAGRLTSCALHQNYCAVECSGTASPTLVDANLQNSTQTPVMMDVNSTPLFSNVTFSSANNGYDAIGLKGTTLASGTATLTKRAVTVGVTPYANITYVQLASLQVNNGASLILSHGIVLKPAANIYFAIYGNLQMNGTIADSVTVTSIHDDTFGQPVDTNHNGSSTSPHVNDWNGIYFYAGSTGTLTYSHLSYGTNSYSNGMVDITGANPSISNCLLFVAAHGITMHGAQSPSISNVAINNCTSCPVLMSLAATPTMSSLSFLGNAITALGIIGENVTGTPHLTQQNLGGYSNITYYVMNAALDIQVGATLTVDPGVVIKFQYGGGGIVVEGAMIAQGAAGNQIVFTSERDDAYGNPKDTNGDANTTQPAAYNWSYLRYTSTANYVTSKFSYCRVLWGSGNLYDGYAANVWMSSPTLTISNCFISGGYHGLRFDGATSPTLTADSIVANLGCPVAMSATIDPTFTGDVLTRNGINGLGLIGETMSGSGTLKYRPTVAFTAPDPPAVLAYVVLGPITVPTGATLAVQPQVVIKPQTGGTFFTVNGALNMVGGLAANRIVVTSFHDDAYAGDTNNNFSATSAAIGQWGNIQINDVSVDAQCIVRNCLFQFGGAGGNAGGVITAYTANPKLAALDFFANVTALTFYGPSTPSLDSLSIQGCTQLPIAMSLQADPSFAHMTFANDAYTALGLLGETITANVRTTVRVLGTGILNGIAYMPTGAISIATGATWTIMPGVVLKLGRAYYDPAGLSINIDGKLVANGKPDSLIVFTSSADDAFGGDTYGDGAATSPAVGQWDAITFSALSAGGGSTMSNCRLRYSGFSNYGIRCVNSNPAISSTNITASYSGISCESAANPTFTNVNIDSCTYLPVRMSLVSNPTFTNVQFIKNYFTGLGVFSETIAQDLLWKIRAVSGRQNMPYIVDGTVGVGLGSTMTLQPGLIVKLRGGSIDVQRAFYAQGAPAPESLIVFTSTRDDYFGGRSDTTAATTAPAPGDWNYVTIEGTAIDANVKFHDCVMRYGGSSNTGVLRAVNSSPAIDSTLFAYNATGISVEGASNPTVSGCSIYGNTNYGIYNNGTSFCVNAQHNWWGAANGPNDASAVADICLLGLNAGTGDKVTDNVDYTNYVNTANGLLTPLLGDVSLNGRVLAYDASLVLQANALLITLTPLQKLVADVNATAGVNALDASLILQYAAGVIRAFPAIFNRAHPASPDELASATRFTVSLGDPVRDATGWNVPVTVTGAAPAWSLELRLDGDGASTLSGVIPSDASELLAMNTADGVARVAMAGASPLPGGVAATLHFDAPDGFHAPHLAWARVNDTEIDFTPSPVAVSRAFLALAGANPAQVSADFTLGLSSREAGVPTRVAIYDLSGRQVRVVQDGVLPAGLHVLRWDLTDGHGRAAPAGVYLVRASSVRFAATTRLVVVR